MQRAGGPKCLGVFRPRKHPTRNLTPTLSDTRESGKPIRFHALIKSSLTLSRLNVNAAEQLQHSTPPTSNKMTPAHPPDDLAGRPKLAEAAYVSFVIKSGSWKQPHPRAALLVASKLRSRHCPKHVGKALPRQLPKPAT